MVIPESGAGYSRVTHPFATDPQEQAPASPFDLHVLSTTPAFVLSQDQTLRKCSLVPIDRSRTETDITKWPFPTDEGTSRFEPDLSEVRRTGPGYLSPAKCFRVQPDLTDSRMGAAWFQQTHLA